MEWDVVAHFSLQGSMLFLKVLAIPSQYGNQNLDPKLRWLLFPSPPMLFFDAPVLGGSWELDDVRSGGRLQGPEISPELVEQERENVPWRFFSGPNPLVGFRAQRLRFRDEEEATVFCEPLLEVTVRNWNEILIRNGREKAIQEFFEERETPILAHGALLALVQARLELRGWRVVLRYGPEGKFWEWGRRIKDIVAELDPALVPLLFA